MLFGLFSGLLGASFLSGASRSPRGGNVGVYASNTRVLYNGLKLLGRHLSSPLQGNLFVTSPYGSRNTGIKGASTCHKGVDLRARYVPVYSVLDGRVVAVANQPKGAGLYVKINHGGSVETCYFHLSRQDVRVGQRVYAGQPIGISGNTGVGGQPHLHFEIRIQGKAVNPMPYIGDFRAIKVCK